LLEIIFGVIGIAGSVVTIIALMMYLRDRGKVEPKIIQTFVRIMDNHDYLIQAVLSNLGNKTADRCGARLYIGDNPVSDLSFVPVDSPLGRIGPDWPAATLFPLHPRTPVTVRGYLSANQRGQKVHVRLFRDNKEVARSYEFSLP
jgi:hypothetical protein